MLDGKENIARKHRCLRVAYLFFKLCELCQPALGQRGGAITPCILKLLIMLKRDPQQSTQSVGPKKGVVTTQWSHRFYLSLCQNKNKIREHTLATVSSSQLHTPAAWHFDRCNWDMNYKLHILRCVYNDRSAFGMQMSRVRSLCKKIN